MILNPNHAVNLVWCHIKSIIRVINAVIKRVIIYRRTPNFRVFGVSFFNIKKLLKRQSLYNWAVMVAPLLKDLLLLAIHAAPSTHNNHIVVHFTPLTSNRPILKIKKLKCSRPPYTVQRKNELKSY